MQMVEFWAFKHAAILKVSKEGHDIDRLVEHLGDLPESTKALFYKLLPIQNGVVLNRTHPLVFRWERSSGRTPRDQWMRQLLSKLVGHEGGAPFGGVDNLFIVVVPQHPNAYVFMLIDRDEQKRSRLKRLQKESVSLLCQEVVVDTCCALVQRMTGVLKS